MSQSILIDEKNLETVEATFTESKEPFIQDYSPSFDYPVTSSLQWFGVLFFVGVVACVGLSSFIQTALCICKPNEVLILAGRQWKRRDGRRQGYRVVQGGLALRIPILETVKRMNLTTMPVRVEVHNAYSKGGIPLHIQAIANIRIANDANIITNAIERFLDHKPQEMIRVARETLEGYLRGIVATLTPEQVNEDRLKFAERIASGVSRDLQLLGLQLDILKIQSVSDDVDYLRSLGRKQIAMILRDAEIAESDCKSEAEKIEAACDEQKNVALMQDKMAVLEQENHLRKIKATLAKEAQTAYEIMMATKAERQARIEQVLQQLRGQVETLRLDAEIVLPAQAQKQAEEYRAKGQAAIHGEIANATAQVNDMLTKVWHEFGNDAAAVVVIQQLEKILTEAAQIPGRLNLDNISVVDDGNGHTVTNLLNIYPQVLQQYLETVHQLLGIDIIGTLKSSIASLPVSQVQHQVPQ